MILRSLKLRNVKSFEEVEVSFVSGKNVVIGNNGSGKSTILQSILYSLFGVAPERTKDTLVRTGTDMAEFEIEFEHNGREYWIERKLRLGGQPEARIIDRLYPDRETRTQTGVTSEVSGILQTRKEVFSDAVFVRQGEIASIIDMQAGKRKELFDKLLGIYDYEEAWHKCSQLEKLLAAKIKQSKTVIDTLAETASKLEERKRDLTSKRLELRSKRAELLKAKKNLRTVQSGWREMENLERKIGNLDSSVNRLEEALGRDEGLADECRKSILRLRNGAGIVFPERLASSDLGSLFQKASQQRDSTVKELVEGNSEYKLLVRTAALLHGLQNMETGIEKDVGELEATVTKARTRVLRILPQLRNLHEREWLTRITEEISSGNKREAGLRAKLNAARQLIKKEQRQSEKVRGIQMAITDLKSKAKKNAEIAASGLGPQWRELARKDAAGIRTDLNGTTRSITKNEVALRGLSKSLGKQENLVQRLKADFDDLASIVGKKCPRCKQIVDEKHATELEEEIETDLEAAKRDLTSSREKEVTARHLSTTLSTKSKELQTTQQRMEKSRIYYRQEMEATRSIESQQRSLKDALIRLNRTKSNLEQTDIAGLDNELKTVGKWTGTLKELRIECRGLLRDASRTSRKQKEVDDLTKKIQEMEVVAPETQVLQKEKQLRGLKQQYDQTKDLVSNLSQLMTLTKRIAKVAAQLQEDSKQVASLRNRYDSAKHKRLEGELNRASEVAGSLQERVRTLSKEQIPQTLEMFEESESAAEKIKELAGEHDKASKGLDVLAKVKDFYREVQRPLRRRDIGKASQHASETFRTLIGSNEYDRVRITEDYDLQISRFGNLESMSTLSGGEQVLAGLAVRMGFARALTSSDLLMLDEPTAFLDEQRRAELVETLYRISPAKQVILVTHDDEFQRIAQRVIHVEKDDLELTSSVSWLE